MLAVWSEGQRDSRCTTVEANSRAAGLSSKAGTFQVNKVASFQMQQLLFICCLLKENIPFSWSFTRPTPLQAMPVHVFLYGGSGAW